MTDINSKIKDNNSKDPVVLYMKGNPTFPQCGFSSTVVQILKHIGVNFQSYDVLQDENLREGIKSFSNWPTIPQLYVNNEFVGGCDIIREMFESGELKEYFTKNNIPLSQD
jgi:monothiol glutaredoxin